MAVNWDYAELVREVKAMGGPKIFIETIENHSFQDGQNAEKARQNPRLVIALGIGVLATVGTQKLISYIKVKRDKQKISVAEVAEAERILIQQLEQAEQDVQEYLEQVLVEETVTEQQDTAEDCPMCSQS
ncbi:hypothetical protein ACIZ62_13745 [Acetobacterium carbinolicum]|uniref:hypothetical protein n=1 Tax=Acetobacterium carbinolicum TaxID=52690 RepID=UPI0039BF622A